MDVKKSSAERIKEAAKELFWKRGISKVSVEEICAEASVSKMSFYRTYSNKLELAELILMEFANEGMIEFDRIVESEVSFNDKIHQILEYKYQRASDISKDLMLDIYANIPELLQHLLAKADSAKQKFVDLLAQAQSSGEISSAFKVDFLVYMLDVFQAAVSDPKCVNLFSSTEEVTRSMSELFFYGIFPHES